MITQTYYCKETQKHPIGYQINIYWLITIILFLNNFVYNKLKGQSCNGKLWVIKMWKIGIHQIDKINRIQRTPSLLTQLYHRGSIPIITKPRLCRPSLTFSNSKKFIFLSPNYMQWYTKSTIVQWKLEKGNCIISIVHQVLYCWN